MVAGKTKATVRAFCHVSDTSVVHVRVMQIDCGKVYCIFFFFFS